MAKIWKTEEENEKKTKRVESSIMTVKSPRWIGTEKRPETEIAALIG